MAARTSFGTAAGAVLALLAGVLPASAVDYGRYRTGTYSPMRDTLVRPQLKSTLPRTYPAPRAGIDRIKPPYPARYYSEPKHGAKGCAWLLNRAIATNNKNWLARYRACVD